MKLNNKPLYQIDPALDHLLKLEEERQENEINLIASENYAPYAIREILSSSLTNKYAEGYPSKRYYGGCHVVDQIENMAIERAKKLFGSSHANVQPHAGSQANMTAYAALIKPGDTIMGMSLASGGHLTHGHLINFSGNYYKSVQYGVRPETELLDFDEIYRLAEIHKPKIIIAGASAYSRTIDFSSFKKVAEFVGAFFIADIAHIAGLIAAGVHPSPVTQSDIVTGTTHKTLRGPRGGFLLCSEKYKDALDRAAFPGLQGGPLMHVIAAKALAFELASLPEFKEYQKAVVHNAHIMAIEFKNRGYRIVSGGTDNHLFIVDLRSKKITGRAAELALGKVGITVSRSCIPFDSEKPSITSGIRLGTPALASRGMSISEVLMIVDLICTLLEKPEDVKTQTNVHNAVKRLCQDFPIYGQLKAYSVNDIKKQIYE